MKRKTAINNNYNNAINITVCIFNIYTYELKCLSQLNQLFSPITAKIAIMGKNIFY